MNDAPTIADVQNLTEEELAALKKAAVRQIAKHIAIKVGTTVVIAGVSAFLTKKLDAANVKNAAKALTE